MPAKSFRSMSPQNKVALRVIPDVAFGHWPSAAGRGTVLAMNDRARASEVLRNARNILAERLTELVLEQREELLDDARGDSYMNEIESLYEQIGVKLSHVGQMLS